MAQYGGFFNSGTTEENKRKYNDYDFAKMLSLLTGCEGYVVGLGSELEVTDASDGLGLKVKVGSGAAWVGEPSGWWFVNEPGDEESRMLDIEPLDQDGTRTDKVVARLDRSTGVQKFYLHVIKEGDSDDELKDDDLKTGYMYDLLLAEVEVTREAETNSIIVKDKRVACINSQSTTIEKTEDWILDLSDMHKFIRVNSGTQVEVTVPINLDVAFPINTEIVFVQHGAGKVSLNSAAGVNIYNSTGLKSAGQYSGFTLRKISENEWYALGSLTSS